MNDSYKHLYEWLLRRATCKKLRKVVYNVWFHKTQGQVKSNMYLSEVCVHIEGHLKKSREWLIRISGQNFGDSGGEGLRYTGSNVLTVLCFQLLYEYFSG